MFIDPLLSKFQCGFRKSYDAQDCLLAMLEHWKSAFDQGNVFAALLTGLKSYLTIETTQHKIKKEHAWHLLASVKAHRHVRRVGVQMCRCVMRVSMMGNESRREGVQSTLNLADSIRSTLWQ